jgi:hypothetical protein
MKLNFLQLPPDDRKLYIEEAAGRRGLSPVILEKDFWVCWLLRVLFGATFSDAIVFKGGTSLSKVFGVIDRFSEDIDLSLAPEFLGLGEPELDASLSKTKAEKWMKTAEAECTNAVRDRLGPELERTVGEFLGKGQEPWLEFVTDPTSHSPVLFFRYPTSQQAGFEYLKRTVKLEFGSLSEQRPTERHPIRPWIADVLPTRSPIGNVTWSRSTSTERSGRKRRFSTASITARQTGRCPIATRGTTPTLRRWPFIA